MKNAVMKTTQRKSLDVDTVVNTFFDVKLDDFCIGVDDAYFYVPRSVGVPEQMYAVSVYDCFDFLERGLRGDSPFRISVNPRGDDINAVTGIECIHIDFDVDKQLVEKVGYNDVVKLVFEEAYKFYKFVNEVAPSALVFTGGGFYIHVFVKFDGVKDVDYLDKLYKLVYLGLTGRLPSDAVCDLFKTYPPTAARRWMFIDYQACRVKELARLPYLLHDKYKIQGKAIVDNKVLPPEEWFEVRKKLVENAVKLSEVLNHIPDKNELDDLLKEYEIWREEVENYLTKPMEMMLKNPAYTTSQRCHRRSFRFVEEVMRNGIIDGRKRVLFLIIVPYLVCKKYWRTCVSSEEDCVKVVKREVEEWLRKCYELGQPGSVYMKWVESLIRWARNRQRRRGDVLEKFCKFKYLKEIKVEVNGVEMTLLEHLAHVNPYFRKFLK